MGFTVVILTQDEQKALPDCLASLKGVDQIVVVDSGSTDQTIEIARQAGAEIWIHPFESFGKQREWATQNPGIRNDWILFLDADERATPAFLDEVTQAVAQDDETIAAYDCAWRLRLYGTWLKRCDGYPRYQTRLVHRQRIHWGDWGHGQKIAEARGKIEKLKEPYDHEAYIHGWDAWWQKHQKYARQEARSTLEGTRTYDGKVGLKKTLRKFPLWPELFWSVRYLLSGSFLFEGKAGWEYCAWRYRYERLCANLTNKARKEGLEILDQGPTN